MLHCHEESGADAPAEGRFRAGMSPLVAFTVEHVSRITGLSPRQLRYWDDIGFFQPSVADERGRPYGRVYSFRDVVALRTLALLRKDYHVPLQQLRRVGAWLAEHYQSPWASLRFYVAGREVYFDDPRTGTRVAAERAGQVAIPIEMEQIARDTEWAADRLRERDCSQIGAITRHRYVAHNAPVVAGTRIPSEAIWSFHEAGYDAAAIIREYPLLTEDEVRAAIAHEAQRRHKLAG